MNTPDNYDLLSDRIKSLLERWDAFHELHPSKTQQCLIGLFSEINDGFTEILVKDKK